jgi:hypothetical protein
MNPYNKKIMLAYIVGFLCGIGAYHVYMSFSAIDFGIATLLFTGGIFFKSAIKTFFQ